MDRDERYSNSLQAWEAARKARADSPLVGVLSRMRGVVAWKGAPKDWKDYGNDLAQILERYRDPWLKLAVIGDFSCGKSTFLNAVMGMELLKADLMATTAVPTLLRWGGEEGEGVRLIAVCADGTPMEVTGRDRDAFESLVDKPLPGDVGAMIDAVTTDNRLVERLRQVEVGLPAQEGRYGLCLVDTPGVNPGAGDTKAHVAVTRRVLRQSADSAIVLFPAQNVFTASFQDFLLENAEHFLNNATFIVTKADAARDDDEVESLRRFVEDVLEQTGVNAPRVYCVAARDALRFDLGRPRKDSDALWSRRFHRDLDEIFANLNRRREAIAVESTGSMISAMIEPLKADLSAHRAQLSERQNVLERWSSAAMRRDCQKLVKAYKDDLIQRRPLRYQRIYDSLDALLVERMQAVEARIRQKNTATALNWYLGHGMRKDFGAIEEPVQQIVADAIQMLHRDYDAFAREMVDCLNRYRVNIASGAAAQYARQAKPEVALNLFVNGESGKNPTALSTVFETLSGASDVVDDLIHLELGEAFSGLFETILSLLEGVFSLFMSMDKRRDDAVKAVYKQMDGLRRKLWAQCREAVNAQEQALARAANALLERLEADYRHVFDEKKRDYDREMQAIRAGIAECERHLKELEDCGEIVRREREKGNNVA